MANKMIDRVLRKAGWKRLSITKKEVAEFRRSLEEATEESNIDFDRARRNCWAKSRYIILD